MKKLISIFLHLALLESCAGFKKTSPVLLMDHDNVMSMTVVPNPFNKINSDSFSDLTAYAIKRAQSVILFIEETLCTEDISTKDNLGTPFHNLQKGIKDEKVVYMPAVSEPYIILQKFFKPVASNIVYLGSGEKFDIGDYYKYVYVFFDDDPKTSRSERLRKHDMLMKEVYFAVKLLKAGPIVAFYTGKRNPITLEQLRYAPRLGAKRKERGVLVATPDALFRLSGLFSSTQTRRSGSEDPPLVEREVRTRNTLSTTMLVTDFHLQFNFQFEDERWRLVNVALLEAGEEVGRTATSIAAPWRRSYYCAEPITIINLRDGSFITISEYQIEPMIPARTRRIETSTESNVTNEQRSRLESGASPQPRTGTYEFSKSENCGPYFNAVILSGVFIFIIFTIITFWGVLMLFNCGTNNRFDDPLQKPLIIPQEAASHGV